MSIQYSDTNTYKGLVQLYEKECGFERGYISGNEDRLKDFTAEVNITFDDFVTMALKTSGRAQFDDSNHEKHPIITLDIVSGQRDYSFTADEQNNLVLAWHKVLVANEDGKFNEISEVDVNTVGSRTCGFFDGSEATGVPYRYDQLGSTIFLDPIPDYDENDGIKIYIDREASYFDYTDTTKKAGVAGTLQAYFYLKPALNYAMRKSADNMQSLLKRVTEFEGTDYTAGKIEKYYAGRNKDEIKNITFKKINHI